MGIVDTSVVISYLRNHTPAVNIFELLVKNEAAQISSITVYELLLGEKAGADPQLQELLSFLPILPLDKAVAERAASIDRMLRRRGERIGVRDTFIAATALANGLPIYTQDVSHFSRIDDLQVIPVP